MSSHSTKGLTPEQKREVHARYSREWRAKQKAKLEKKKHSPTTEIRKVHARAVAKKILENPSLSVSGAAKELGITSVSVNPGLVTKTAEWQELLDSYLPQTDVLEAHRGLLRAAHIDHMTFTRDGEPSDEEIGVMLAEVNCKIRKIVHGEQARHVYFFAPDNRARKDALDMLYKLRGSYAMDKAAVAFSLAALASSRDVETPVIEQPAESGTLPAARDMPRLPRPID